jgi:hypothetical protein
MVTGPRVLGRTRRAEGDPVVAGVEDEQRDVAVLGKQVDESPDLTDRRSQQNRRSGLRARTVSPERQRYER